MKPSEALRIHRDAIRRVVEAHRARNARVFGSAAHGDDPNEREPKSAAVCEPEPFRW